MALHGQRSETRCTYEDGLEDAAKEAEDRIGSEGPVHEGITPSIADKIRNEECALIAGCIRALKNAAPESRADRVGLDTPRAASSDTAPVAATPSATVTPRYLVYSYDKGQTTPHFTDHPKEWDGTDGDCSVLVDLHTGQRKAFGEWQAVDRYRCDSAARTEIESPKACPWCCRGPSYNHAQCGKTAPAEVDAIESRSYICLCGDRVVKLSDGPSKP